MERPQMERPQMERPQMERRKMKSATSFFLLGVVQLAQHFVIGLYTVG